MHLGYGLDPGCNTLVAMAATHFGEAGTVRFHHLDAGFGGLFQKLAHACIAPRGLKVELDDGVGGGFEAHAQGVKAEENFG